MKIIEQIPYYESKTTFYFNSSFDDLKELAPVESSFIITDENLFQHYQHELSFWKVIRIPAGESSKSFLIVEHIIRQLLGFQADRNCLLVGFGGGVITDLTGFIAGIYKRGVRFGFMPTSILGMVDASVGGKNGINFDSIKNCIGLLKHPEFILHNFSLLRTLPKKEWINGFAEIIKHSCLFKNDLFEYLNKYTLTDFLEDESLIENIIKNNAILKAKFVQEDEADLGSRRILNFGHTLGHAIESEHLLAHGQAVTVGIVFAAWLSETYLGFTRSDDLKILIKRYDLPISFPFNKLRTLQRIQQDKKRESQFVNFILLEEIGKPSVKPISMKDLESKILQF